VNFDLSGHRQTLQISAKSGEIGPQPRRRAPPADWYSRQTIPEARQWCICPGRPRFV